VNIFDLIASSPVWRQPALLIVANVVVMAAFVLIAAAVIVDFRAYHRQDRAVVSSDRSLVETGSMTAFFVAYYLVARLHLGEVVLAEPVRYPLILVGIALIVVGVAVNIWGRLALKSFWANQIKIYEGHRLLTRGPFALVRHPLYASLIWTFVGGALVYANVLALALTLCVFVPMMYVRAKREDALLAETFPDEHRSYKARTWMFLPKPWRSQ
jgi:protein-S-isoprenylcysteine O-methyltransferase Ste14